MLQGIQEIPQEHLHVFQLFMQLIWSQQHFSSWSVYSCSIGWTLKTIHALLTNLWGVKVGGGSYSSCN